MTATATVYTFDAATGARDLDQGDWLLGCKTVGALLGVAVWVATVTVGFATASWLMAILTWIIALIAALLLVAKVDAGWQADKVEVVGYVAGKAINKFKGLFGRR